MVLHMTAIMSNVILGTLFAEVTGKISGRMLLEQIVWQGRIACLVCMHLKTKFSDIYSPLPVIDNLELECTEISGRCDLGC